MRPRYILAFRGGHRCRGRYCEMSNGRAWNHFYRERPAIAVSLGKTTGSSWKRCYGSPERAARGVTSIPSWATGIPCIHASLAGARKAFGNDSLTECAMIRICRRCLSIARPFEHTNMLLGPKKTRSASTGTLARGPEHEDSCDGRCAGQPIAMATDRRGGQRHHPSGGAHRRLHYATGHRRQGLRLDAVYRQHCGHGGSSGHSSAQEPPRQAYLRPPLLPRTPSDRVHFQQIEAISSYRNPL